MYSGAGRRRELPGLPAKPPPAFCRRKRQVPISQGRGGERASERKGVWGWGDSAGQEVGRTNQNGRLGVSLPAFFSPKTLSNGDRVCNLPHCLGGSEPWGPEADPVSQSVCMSQCHHPSPTVTVTRWPCLSLASLLCKTKVSSGSASGSDFFY